MGSLELAGSPVERIAVDVLVVPLFEAETPLRGAAGRVDWRLCGRLSRLAAAGGMPCAVGGALLTPGGGGVRAPRILGLGLGRRAELGAERWEAWLADALERARLLRAGSLALALPACGDQIAERLAQLAAAAASGLAPERVLVAPDPGEESAAGQWFRRASRRGQAGDLQVMAPPDSRGPRGANPAAGRADAPAQPARSSHAPTGRFTR